MSQTVGTMDSATLTGVLLGTHLFCAGSSLPHRLFSGWGLLVVAVHGLLIAVASLVTAPRLQSTLCDPLDCSTPGFPVHHQPPELAKTHVH